MKKSATSLPTLLLVLVSKSVAIGGKQNFKTVTVLEQKRIRQEDPTIVSSPPYLLTSKLLDLTCESVPIVNRICPSVEDGGWRSLVANSWGYAELVTFPHGKLSHSFYSTLGRYGDIIKADVTYDKYMDGINSGSSLSTTLNSYYNFAFQTSTTTLCDLTHPLALCVLFILVVFFRIITKLALSKLTKIGHDLGEARHGKEWSNKNAERIIKFGENVYILISRTVFSMYGLLYFYDKPWWKNSMGGTRNLWEGHPNHPVEPGMAWYYLLQCAKHVEELVTIIEMSFTFELVNPLSLLTKQSMKSNEGQVFFWTPLFQVKWSRTVRGDTHVLMAHHVVTIALIFFSSLYRFTRVGSMILLVHDMSENPVQMSKIANFFKMKATTVFLVISMLVVWIASRLIIFPFVICKSVWYESYEYMVLMGTLDPAAYEAYYLPFYISLGFLIYLHIIWFSALLKIGWKIVSTEEGHSSATMMEVITTTRENIDREWKHTNKKLLGRESVVLRTNEALEVDTRQDIVSNHRSTNNDYCARDTPDSDKYKGGEKQKDN